MDAGRQCPRRYEEPIYQQVQQSRMAQGRGGEKISFDRIEGIFKHQYGLKHTGCSGVKRLASRASRKRQGHQNFATVSGDMEAGKLIEVIDSPEPKDIIEVLPQPLEVREPVGRIPKSG